MSEALALDPPPQTRLARAWQEATSRCIKCGFCLPACPTYRETGLEVSSPRGRLELMYRVAQGTLPLDTMRHELWRCLGCLACETACPSGIPFHEMLEPARCDDAAARAAKGTLPWRQRFLLNHVLVGRGWLWIAACGLYVLQRSGLRRALAALPGPLSRLMRQAPPIPVPWPWRWGARRHLVRRKETSDAGAMAAADGARPVALLRGCVMDTVFGGVHAATAKVLHANGCAVHLPAGQGCCGALHQHAGHEAEAQALARRNIAAFEALGDAPIVVDSAGCGAMLKSYGSLLRDDPDWHARAEAFSARVQDVCEFLAALPLRPPTRSVPRKVAYDDPCHLLHAQKIREAPRTVLAAIPGLELVPLAESDWCCGSAGSYSLQQPELAQRILLRKLEHIEASVADVVATGNPGCLLQLALGMREARLRVRVVHPVELLADAYA